MHKTWLAEHHDSIMIASFYEKGKKSTMKNHGDWFPKLFFQFSANFYLTYSMISISSEFLYQMPKLALFEMEFIVY